MSWKLDPKLQQKFDAVVAQTAQLQTEMGIKPRTLAERAADYERKQAEAANVVQKQQRRHLPKL